MRNIATAAMHRRYVALEETVARASMPRTDAADPAPKGRPVPSQVLAVRGGLRLVRPLTFKLSEVL